MSEAIGFSTYVEGGSARFAAALRDINGNELPLEDMRLLVLAPDETASFVNETEVVGGQCVGIISLTVAGLWRYRFESLTEPYAVYEGAFTVVARTVPGLVGPGGDAPTVSNNWRIAELSVLSPLLGSDLMVIERDDVTYRTTLAVVGEFAWTVDSARLSNLNDVDTAGVADGDSLVYDESTDKWIPGASSSNLHALTDVTLTTPADNQVLVYDGGTEQWINGDFPSSVTTIAGLSDVAIKSPTDGQVLTYDSVTSKWINESIPSVGLDDLTDVLLTGLGGADKHVLTYDVGSKLWTNALIPAPELLLDDVLDVTITTPSNGDVLTFQGGEWVNEPAASVPTLDDVGDVDLDTITDGDQLVYGSGIWYNRPSVVPFLCSVGGTPSASQFIGGVSAPVTVSFPANFAGSAAKCRTAPTATFAIDVKLNGSTIGTISFAAAATTATFTTVGGTAKAVSSGDYIEFFAPATPDLTMADFYFTLFAYRSA